MINLSEAETKSFRIVQILAAVIYVVNPAIFLGLAAVLDMPVREFEDIELVQYLLLFLSLFFPTVTMGIRKLFVSRLKKGQGQNMAPETMFFTMFMLIAAVVEAIYIFGLMIYFLSGDIQRMLYFYPIGIAWTFMHWPTRERFEAFIEQANRP